MKRGLKPCGWACATPHYFVPPEPPQPLHGSSLLDRFAEELADHGDIAAASAAIRVPLGIGESLFKRICKQLGQQAQ